MRDDMTQAEVDATLTMYMLDKCRAQGETNRIKAEGANKKEKHARRRPGANSTTQGTRPTPVESATIGAMIEVINMHSDTVDALAQLPGKIAAEWHLAVKQLKASRGPQVVTIRDTQAAEQLAAAGLVTPKLYRGQVVSGKFIISRAKAFCSMEPAGRIDRSFMAPINAR